MYGYIYKTINSVNGKIYIGQKKSKTFLNNNYLGSGKYLKHAINKYGKNSFTVELLCWCETKDELDKKEVFFIEKYTSKNSLAGYNIANGGEGSNGGAFKGKHHSDDTKLKLSETMKEQNATRVNNGLKPFNWDHHNISPGNKGKKRIYKDGIYKYVKEEDLSIYLLDGWKYNFKIKSKFKRIERKLSSEERQLLSKKVSETMCGHSVSEETKQKLSEKNRGQIPFNKGKLRVFKDNQYKFISCNELETFINEGWVRK